jgi:hypothetical protein
MFLIDEERLEQEVAIAVDHPGGHGPEETDP